MKQELFSAYDSIEYELKKLEEKAQKLVLKYTQYEVQYQGLSLEDLWVFTR